MESVKPLHPYNILLCKVGIHVGEKMEYMHSLGRMMGCQKTTDIECPSLLFQKLEREGKLSEFKVVDFRNALEVVGLSKAAELVTVYQDTHLSENELSRTPQDAPPPYTSITSERVDTNDVIPPIPSLDEDNTEQNNGAGNKDILPLRNPEPSMSTGGEEELDQPNGTRRKSTESGIGLSRKKYHTITVATMQQQYPHKNIEAFDSPKQ